MRLSLLALPLLLALPTPSTAKPIAGLPRPNACAARDVDLSIFCAEQTLCPQIQNGTLTACMDRFKIFYWADCIDAQVALREASGENATARFEDGGLIVCSVMGPNGELPSAAGRMGAGVLGVVGGVVGAVVVGMVVV